MMIMKLSIFCILLYIFTGHRDKLFDKVELEDDLDVDEVEEKYQKLPHNEDSLGNRDKKSPSNQRYVYWYFGGFFPDFIWQ